MVRILQITGSLNRGGIETFLMNVYRNIDREKVQFDFLLSVESECHYTQEVLALGGRIYSVPSRRKGVFENVRALNAFFEKHTEYHIVHAHVSSLSGVSGLKAARRHSVPVRIVHSHNTSEGGNPFHKYIHLWNQRKVDSIATDYFSCSVLAALWLYGQKRFDNKQFIIINNGIDIEAFKFSEHSRKKIREEFKIGDRLVIGHIGRFAKQKNHAFLIEVFKAVSEINSNARLLLIGDGELRKQTQEKVNLLGLRDKVIFTGVRTDTTDLYSAMDVLLLPSLHEGLPVVLIEAQASGLPCVVSAEAVSEEVKLTENFAFIPLGAPTNVWASACLNAAETAREYDAAPLQLSKYDIHKVADELSDFYLSKGRLNYD